MDLKCLQKHIIQMFGIVLIGVLVIYFWPVVTTPHGVLWRMGGILWPSNAFFHLFHFSHIFFATATSFITLYGIWKSFAISAALSIILPICICTVSDVLLPYVGGILLNVDMALHMCLTCNFSAMMVFVLCGLLLGTLFCYVPLLKKQEPHFHFASHILHGFLSCLSSLVYLVGFGFFQWQAYFIPVLLLMLVVVIIPCVVSDYLAPQAISRWLLKKSDSQDLCVTSCSDKH